MIQGMIQSMLGRMPEVGDYMKRKLSVRIEDHGAWEKVLAKGAEDTGAYLGYLCDGLGDRKLVADITPGYSLLSEQRLRQMAGIVPDTRFVYLMRDPLGRLWSHVRMHSQRMRGGDKVDAGHAHKVLARVIKGSPHHRDIAERSDYRAVLEKMDAAVPRDRRLAMFYEDLFTADGLDRLHDFLGIGPKEADTEKTIHGGAPADLDPQAAEAARAWLAPQYDYVERRLGALPAAWRAQAAKV